jgi:glutathione S-transferase
VIRVYGFGELPDLTPGRKEVRRLSGQSLVPVLLLDDGEVVVGSDSIVEWAEAHPTS